ncbi:uncharacterized protein PV09_07123 [Verruconis gallopava]|uniref:Uncharacterized protein n=1 Tax=Verruconis gallopava TaxID=253628 RepID=A0A0D1XGL7_9PEZI|nr:uncharacterized protein PV09_07123 [Verruconis gallopava]KIW01351.1 hypothetical protein PV09_07123 [Verruconis gallopava]
MLLLSVLNFKRFQNRGPNPQQNVQHQTQAIHHLYQRHRCALADITQLERQLEAASLNDTDLLPSPKKIKTEDGAIPARSSVKTLGSTLAFIPDEIPRKKARSSGDTSLDIEMLLLRTRQFLANIENLSSLLGKATHVGVLELAERKLQEQSRHMVNILIIYLNSPDLSFQVNNLSKSSDPLRQRGN